MCIFSELRTDNDVTNGILIRSTYFYFPKQRETIDKNHLFVPLGLFTKLYFRSLRLDENDEHPI